MADVQDAIEEAMQPYGGIRELIDSMCHGGGELAARVSSVWLKSYLTTEQRAAISRLSVFAGSFSADGAAAVLYESGAYILCAANYL